MSILSPLIMAFACFSTIPMPHLEWDAAHMRYMMAAFPLVGAVIGTCMLLWGQLCATLGFGQVLLGAGFTVIPILVSGGIHMDGLADVIDAQASHASPERKREILKDPHVGAFAIIGVGCYLLIYLGFVCEAQPHQLVDLACIPILSRCLSGFATVTFRPSKTSGMFASESQTSSATVVRVLLGVQGALATALLASRNVLVCAVVFATGIVCLAYVHHIARRDFGGMSGDLAGFFLQMAELAMLIVTVLVGRLVMP